MEKGSHTDVLDRCVERVHKMIAEVERYLPMPRKDVH